jgi:tRNA(Ile2) C34 agmatinyltransferase TiaS
MAHGTACPSCEGLLAADGNGGYVCDKCNQEFEPLETCFP